jgi:hypothetical protein
MDRDETVTLAAIQAVQTRGCQQDVGPFVQFSAV